MEQRDIPRLGRSVSCVGFGGWQLGADWGDVPEATGIAAVEAALAAGVTFIDTADAYGDGRSEKLIGRVLATHTGERPFVATKMGRRVPQEHAEYTPARFREWNDRSRANLGVETLDLVQLHSPPTAVIEDDALFDVLDEFVAGGARRRLRRLGRDLRPGAHGDRAPGSRDRADRPQRLPPEAARARAAGRTRRRGWASSRASRWRAGCSRAATPAQRRSGPTITAPTTATARRSTPARRSPGVDFETGLEAVRRLAPLVPPGATMAQWALRWVLDQPGVSVVIPGARNPEQARANAAAAGLAPLSPDDLAAVRAVYDELIRPSVHARW